MNTQSIQTDYDMDTQEWAEFQRDYDRWCLEVELDRIQILDNSKSRNKTVNQNS
jgi:hypothetical protein